jgi:hypothetical protein
MTKKEKSEWIKYLNATPHPVIGVSWPCTCHIPNWVKEKNAIAYKIYIEKSEN